MTKFEVVVYNAAVREAVKFGDHHKEFEDDWADPHYIEIQSENEDKARARAAVKYPENRGFVIVAVNEATDI
ncbi:MAG TPA: hypothetical protein ENI55_01835 [Alphaproteobacteria bacterium]|nr:hypothetical protein [Alphaproteobacteria bacterium]